MRKIDPELQFRRDINERLADKWLSPNDEKYEPIYESCGPADPVGKMRKRIEFASTDSFQLFSGFRGSGKTTELRRLKGELEAQGYFVLYGDALKYLNPSIKIDISDLLLVIAGTFSDALEEAGFSSVANDSYWHRFVNFLTKTKVNLDELGLKAGTEGIEADLKLSLKSTPTFRQALQNSLLNNIGDLKKDVDKFFEDGVKAIHKKHGDDIPGVVFLFDSLEQLRDSSYSEKTVTESVLQLFAHHRDFLKVPYMHMVYTVPPWLRFALPGTDAQTTRVPCVRYWNNDEQRTPHEPGWKSLRSLVHRRFSKEGYEKFFDGKQGQHPLADNLIAVCGGHFRDLLLLLRETNYIAETLPVNEVDVNTAIQTVRSHFLPIAVDDAKWLDKIARHRDTMLEANDSETVDRLTRFLDTHFVLYFQGDEEWYDIHPLIRDEVAKIVAREAAFNSSPIVPASS